MQAVLFSICIPNYNYTRYLPLTCESVVSQHASYEIVVADNRSTDDSVALVKAFKDLHSSIQIKIEINATNLGFAGNLEKVTRLARGSHFILLSSDDLMNVGALQKYEQLIELSGFSNLVIGSSVLKIDSEGTVFDRGGPDPQFWKSTDIEPALSQRIGHTVYAVTGAEMLARCLQAMGNPYYFLTVCYPSSLFEQVGGYGGGRMYNPDKWFNWKLFEKADMVYLIDEPLFSYRWHAQNQVALETSFGHLKYLIDEYRNTIELSDTMLNRAGFNRLQAEKKFIHRDVYRHGIGSFVKGSWVKSLRIFFFGLSTFPKLMIMHRYFILYFILLSTLPVGSYLASKVFPLFKR